MWRNYLAAAIRNLFRDRAYAAINIFGLALGFTAMLLIALYVRDEYSFDRQFPHADRTYRTWMEATQPGRAPIRLPSSPPNIARALELYFPEVEFATRLKGDLFSLRQGNVEITLSQGFYWADPSFFRMFPMKVIAGDVNAALSSPDGLVLSRTMARRLFNRDDVLGQAVTYNRQQTLRVAAVIEDLPWNTHFLIEAVGSGLASFSALAQMDRPASPDALQPENVYTYVRLRRGASIEKVNAAMTQFAQRYYSNQRAARASGITVRFSLVPLRDLHFLPPSVALDMKPPSDPRTVRGMILIAALILLVAASNFISMMTARAARRAIEVGVRKSAGATRRQIIVQFLAECLFYSGLALAVSLVAVWLLLPAFNGFLQRGIGFDFVRDPQLAAAVIAGWLAVGLAAGAYPALVLSRFRPVTVLKGMVALPGGPGRLRQAMVVLQFGTLVALMIATITIHRQTRFALEDRLRVPGGQLFHISYACYVPGLRDILAAIPGVRAAGCASEWEETGAVMGFVGAGRDPINVRALHVDSSYLGLLGVTPIAGRLLDEQHGEDLTLVDTGAHANPSVVINEAAARALGYANPRDAVGQYRRWVRREFVAGVVRTLDPQASRIVGVVPDFSLGSVRERIEPTGYYIDPASSFSLFIKLDGATIPETMRRVQAVWRKVSDGRPFHGEFLSQILNALYADIQRQTTLFSAFSAVAVVVASLGLLGLAVFTAERRTREIGVRKAMGASRMDILRFIGWQFARPVLIANLVAWPIAWFFMRRWLEGFAYHVDLGPLAFALASALALAIALVTVSGHAILVSRARPVDALRYE